MYKSSRNVNQLQFDVNNVKLGQLPGVFDTIQNEGGFFKLFSDDWANDYWEERWDVEPSIVADDWYNYFLKQNEAWVNPAYATDDVNDDFVCRVIYPEGQKREISLCVIYDNINDTIVGWYVNAD